MLIFFSIFMPLFLSNLLFAAQAQQYSPFMVVTATDKVGSKWPIEYTLPSKYYVDSTEENEKLKLSANVMNPVEIPLCPELRQSNEEENYEGYLKKLKRDIPSMAGCLFATSFTENEIPMCKKEPQPWLGNRRHSDDDPYICGINKYHRLINSEYYNCGTEETLRIHNLKEKAARREEKPRPHFLANKYVMYEICYDFDHQKTLWIRHKILTPELLAHKKYPYTSTDDTFNLDEFSTKQFHLEDVKDGIFDSLKALYKSAGVTMEIHPLVPKSHMALPYWKKSITHMINSAPLLPKFFPLMEAINNGIFIASTYVLLKRESDLKIYTKVDKFKDITKTSFHAKILEKAKNLLNTPDDPTALFEQNVWYVFVHNERDNSGILIVLHNTSAPALAKKECEKDETLQCDFPKWSTNSDSIESDYSEYAYCCRISEKKVKELFLIKEDFPNISTFDMQATINLAMEESLEGKVNEEKETDSSKLE